MERAQAQDLADRLNEAGLSVKAIFDDVLATWCVASGAVHFAEPGVMPPKWLKILEIPGDGVSWS